MVKTLPFYLLEAGCFLADPNYIIQREYHNSYLLLYTRNGQGTLKTQGVSLSLGPESCVVLDCHKPHEYCCSGEEWEFLWFHFGGSGADTLYPLLSRLLHAWLNQEQRDQKGTYDREISWAVTYIKEHYGEPITIDDMIQTLPISKFHFIRCFRRLLGSPQQHLGHIDPVIGQACGFQEASNFIAHFKKHTGLRPSAYRRIFLQE